MLPLNTWTRWVSISPSGLSMNSSDGLIRANHFTDLYDISYKNKVHTLQATS